MNIASTYKTLTRKLTQTFSAIMLSFLLTANSQQRQKNVTLVAKLFFSQKEFRTKKAINPYSDWVLSSYTLDTKCYTSVTFLRWFVEKYPVTLNTYSHS